MSDTYSVARTTPDDVIWPDSTAPAPMRARAVPNDIIWPGEQPKQAAAPKAPPSDIIWPDEGKPPRAGFLETAGLVGGQLLDVVTHHAPAGLASALEGDEPFAERDWKDALIERSRARAQERSAAAGTGPTMIPGVGREDIAQLGASLGQSVTPMVGGAATGVGTAAAATPLTTPAGGAAAGWAAGVGTAGTLAYRQATNQFVRDLRDSVNQDRAAAGVSPINDAEFQQKATELAPLIREYGLWEAIPEAAGEALGLGIITAPVKGAIGRLFGRNVLTRIASKTAALYGTELGTETVTQQGQHNVELTAGMKPGEQPREWTNPADIAASFKEVAPVTALQTTLMAGGVKGAHMLMNRGGVQPQPSVVPPGPAPLEGEVLPPEGAPPPGAGPAPTGPIIEGEATPVLNTNLLTQGNSNDREGGPGIPGEVGGGQEPVQAGNIQGAGGEAAGAGGVFQEPETGPLADQARKGLNRTDLAALFDDPRSAAEIRADLEAKRRGREEAAQHAAGEEAVNAAAQAEGAQHGAELAESPPAQPEGTRAAPVHLETPQDVHVGAEQTAQPTPKATGFVDQLRQDQQAVKGKPAAPAFDWAAAKPGDTLPDATTLVQKGILTRREANAIAQREGGQIVRDGAEKFAVVKHPGLRIKSLETGHETHVPVGAEPAPKPVTPQIPNEPGTKYVLPSFATGHKPQAAPKGEVKQNPRAKPPEVMRVEPEQPKAPEPGPSSSEPLITLARSLKDRLASGKPITAKIIQDEATKAHGGTLAEGRFDRKDMFDALELAVNMHIKEADLTHNPWGRSLKWLDLILSELPTQTVRSEEQVKFQQFSTPPTYAFAVAHAANVREGDTVLEPSAGTGSLVAAVSRPGVTIVANELSDRRAAMLRALVGNDGKVFTENAEQLNNVLPKDVKPTVVVMNPPFSQTAGRMGDKRDINVGANHIEQALKRLEPGGRLVAIVGRGMTMGAPRFRDWWARIGEANTVRANIGVEGSVYGKYGTHFGTRLLVIDKVAPTGEKPILTDAQTVDDLMRALEPVRNARPAAELVRSEPSSQPVAEGNQGARSERPARPEPRVLGPGERGERGVAEPGPARPGAAGARPAGVEAGERPGVAPVQPERPGQAGAGGEPRPSDQGSRQPEVSGGERPGGNLQPPASGQPSATASGERIVVEQAAPGTQAASEISESLYESYEPQRVRINGAKKHPGPLVESAAMSSVSPPAPTYKPSIPRKVIDDGLLSLPQLEAVVYAGQAHERTLPAAEGATGKRAGYFIGDGTGVGKGREIAGIILDNWQQGRTKAVWVSEKRKLLNDAQRDWSGLGQDQNNIFNAGKVKTGEPIQAAKGIAFITYDTLKGGMSDQAALARGAFVRKQRVQVNGQGGEVAKVEKGRKNEPAQITVKLDNGSDIRVPATEVTAVGETNAKSRVDQLVEWFGKDYDGVIAFDEAHNMGNAAATKGDRGEKEAAQKALAGLQLQERLPNARVVYVSATGATEVSNLAYADRLGLWGKGTPFASRDQFVSEVEQGGIAAMELIARDMKQLGLYIARNLSYDGVEYSRLEHKLDANQREIYDTVAEAWQGVLRNINAALKLTGGNKDAKAKSAAMSAFWGGHQRFFNQIITSLQMPSVIKAVEADLKAGRQAVLQLTNTNEAAQERAAAKAETAEDIEDLDITPRDQIIQLVENSFPTQQYEKYVDEDGKERTRPVLDSAGNPVQNADAVRMREELVDKLGSIKVPQGPLDMVLDHFGIDTVAEVTGRKRRFVMKADEKTGAMRRVEDSRPMSANQAEIDTFQAGKKKVLVFSEAGGTGASYHADNRSASKGSRRAHYLVQAGWRADKAVQGFGRTHRTNQASAPIFHLVTTDLDGQKRFISSIARRLGQLGALTKGERKAGDQGVFSARDNLESIEATTALKQFYHALSAGSIEDVSIDEFERQTGLELRQRTSDGAVLGMKQELPPITTFLNRLLSLKIGLQNRVFAAFSENLDAVIEARTQAGLLDAGLETVRADKITKDSEKTVHTAPDSAAETKYVKLTIANKFVPTKFESVANNRNRKVSEWVKSPNGKVYAVTEAPSRTQADTGAIVPQFRLIGPSSTRLIEQHHLQDRNASGEFGKSWSRIDKAKAETLWQDEIDKAPEFVTRDMHLITGAILPIWDRLKGDPRVVRLQTDQGERLLGRVVPESRINETLRALGAETQGKKVDPATLFTRLMSGAQAKLANGWTLKRSLVAGEQRIELKGPSSPSEGAQVKADGAFSERIAYETRYFIPTEEEAGRKALAAITEHRPVVETSGGRAEAQYSLSQGGLTPAAQQRRADIERVLGQLVSHLVGKNVAVQFPDTIPIGNANLEAWGSMGSGVQTAAGVYNPATALIELAMADPAYQGVPLTTAFHESFHAVEHLLMNGSELALMKRETARLRKWLNEHAEIMRDAKPGWANDIADFEVRAIAFEMYATRRFQDKPMDGFHTGIARLFNRLLLLLKRIRNKLSGLGFKTAEDIFSQVYRGEMAGRRGRGEKSTADQAEPQNSLSYSETMRSGFYFNAARKLSDVPAALFPQGGWAVINWLRQAGVKQSEINHFELAEELGNQKPVTREQFEDQIAARMFDFKRKTRWFNPERSTSDYDNGGTRAFAGPRVPGRGEYFERTMAFPKKLKGGEAFPPGMFKSPHWEHFLPGAWASWRGSVREVPGFGKMMIGEEGQTDYMQGAQSRGEEGGARRPRIKAKDYLALTQERDRYNHVMRDAYYAAGHAVRGMNIMPTTRDRFQNELASYPSSYGAVHEVSSEAWHERLNEVRDWWAAQPGGYSKTDAIAALEKLKSLRDANEAYFQPGAHKKFAKTESSFTPESPLDESYVRTMVRDLLMFAAKEKVDSVAIATSDTTARVQNNPAAAHFYDAQLKPAVERELRRITGDSSISLEEVKLPKPLGGKRERPYTVWATKLPPAARAAAGGGMPMFSAGRPRMRGDGEVNIPAETIAAQLEARNLPKLAGLASAARVGKFNTTEARTQVQDKFIRWKHIQDAVEEATGEKLPEAMNVYMAESLYYGRTGQRLEELEKNYIDPLVAEIKKHGLTADEVNQYLIAKHAPERNAQVRKINPDIANPSGMSDEEAQKILDDIDDDGKRDAYEAVEKKFRALIDETRVALVAGGLISQNTLDAWENAYQHYAPLRGFAEDSETEDTLGHYGKGYDVRGPESRRALGRTSLADGPLAYAMLQAQQAIVRAEKAQVGRTAMRFVNANPLPGLWKIDKGDTKRVIDPNTGLVTEMVDPLWRTRDNVFALKINGETYFINFEGEYGANLARALKNLGTANLHPALRMISTFTRLQARLATSWNPDFMIPNLVRDMGEAFINMQEQDQKAFTKQFVKHLRGVMGGTFLALTGKDGGKYAQAFREFDEAGGRIRFFGMEDVEDIKKTVASKMRRLEGGAVNNMIAAGEKALQAIEIVNATIENATRLAVYMAARDVGMSKAKAASTAREITVNFNRKGELGSAISALYMFANASMQGSTRMLRAMKSSKWVRRAAYSVAAMGASLALYNLASGGDDDDGVPYYLKLPSWERDTNMILMWPKGMGHDGQYVKIPLPYGYSFFHTIGARMIAMSFGKEKPAKAIGAMASSVLDAFDPLGKDENMLAQFAPTLARPAIHLATNKNWTGRPINPEPMPWNRNEPDASRYFRSASPFAIAAADQINRATGGTKHESGLVDWSPGTIDYMLGFITGGLGRFALNVNTTALGLYNGTEWQVDKTPIVRRFYGIKSDAADRQLYFEERNKVMAAHARRTAYSKDEDQKNLDKLERESRPELDVYGQFVGADRQRTQIRKDIDEIKANDKFSPREKERRVKLKEREELDLMLGARRALQDQQRAPAH